MNYEPIDLIEDRGLGYSLGTAVVHLTQAADSDADVKRGHLLEAISHINRTMQQARCGRFVPANTKPYKITEEQYSTDKNLPDNVYYALQCILHYAAIYGQDMAHHEKVLQEAITFINAELNS